MAYLRWVASPWYVYWHASDAREKEDEILFVGYSKGEQEYYTYLQVAMLLQNPSEIPGYNEENKRNQAAIVESLQDFIDDVDTHYG